MTKFNEALELELGRVYRSLLHMLTSGTKPSVDSPLFEDRADWVAMDDTDTLYGAVQISKELAGTDHDVRFDLTLSPSFVAEDGGDIIQGVTFTDVLLRTTN